MIGNPQVAGKDARPLREAENARGVQIRPRTPIGSEKISRGPRRSAVREKPSSQRGLICPLRPVRPADFRGTDGLEIAPETLQGNAFHLDFPCRAETQSAQDR